MSAQQPLQGFWLAAECDPLHLRVWGLSGNKVVHQASVDWRNGQPSHAECERALLALVDTWLTEGTQTPLVISGLQAGDRAPSPAGYRAIPCPPLGGPPARIASADPRLKIFAVPGLKQAQPTDVLCGAESRIAGFLTQHPGWDGVICLPGTDTTSWVHVSADEIVSFQTFMTGELFSFCSERLALPSEAMRWDTDGFFAGVAQGLEAPEKLMARLFSLRAQGILRVPDASTLRARLSGLLIGAELAAAKPYWLGQRVAVLGAAPFTQHYAQALGTLFVPVTVHDAADTILDGLFAASALLPKDDRPCLT